MYCKNTQNKCVYNTNTPVVAIKTWFWLHLQRALAPLPQKVSFVSDKDVAWLEDDSGRIKLAGVNLDIGGLSPASMLTGQVVAVRGCENGQGDFEVHGIVLPNFAEQPDVTISK